MVNEDYLRKQGQLLFGLLQGLKRRPEHAAADLGVSLDKVQAVLDGELQQETIDVLIGHARLLLDQSLLVGAGSKSPAHVSSLTPDLVQRLVARYPLNERDLYPLHDDAPSGVKVMRAAESEATSRVMQRPNKEGKLADYYDYRDTVTTQVALFRPEWIQELHLVDTNDPEELADTQWNKGHFEHQFTYFVGPVNFYYMEDGKKKVAVMNTGDSMYITPFVPHTFATRKNEAGELGLILALTYGDKISGDTQAEFAAIGRHLARNFALDFSTQEQAFASLLRYHMDAGSVTVHELALRLGKNKNYVELVLGGEGSIADITQYAVPFAKALRVGLRDLLPPAAEPKVVVHPYTEAQKWGYGGTEKDPVYTLVELAPVRNLPSSKGLEITVTREGDQNVLDLIAPSHQYIYNAGDSSVSLNYEDARDLSGQAVSLGPGDSAYIKPFVPHNFRGEGKLLTLRIGGRVGGEAMRQLSLVDDADRAIAETTPWFQDAVE